MTPDEMKAIIMSFPGAEEGMSYGSPSFKVNGKFFTRLRREDASVVLVDISMDEREMLMEAEPGTFHITPHYKDYPSVLARIETLHPGSFRSFLERRFRKVAKKSVVKAWEGGRARSSVREDPLTRRAGAPPVGEQVCRAWFLPRRGRWRAAPEGVSSGL